MDRIEQEIRTRQAQIAAAGDRLEQAVDVLTRLVRVVAAQKDRSARTVDQVGRRVDQLGARLDRLARAIATGRTADTRRLRQLERRIDGIV